MASTCETGIGILLSSGLLTSGGDGVTRMVWLKGQEVEYKNKWGVGAVPVGLVRTGTVRG